MARGCSRRGVVGVASAAWRLCTSVFSYTNHTLMAEALETWHVEMLQRLLPRHMKIIYDINELFLDQVRSKYPGDNDLLRRVSLIDEGPERLGLMQRGLDATVGN